MNTVQALQLVQDINQVRRKARRPVHKHLIEYRPFQLQPFFIAPVLPGETLKRVERAMSGDFRPPQGWRGQHPPWWCEHFYFYVKVRQLGIRCVLPSRPWFSRVRPSRLTTPLRPRPITMAGPLIG